MTLDEIINLFERIEAGEEGQMLGYHIHKPIIQVENVIYGPHNEKRFSDFLKDLKEHEPV